MSGEQQEMIAQTHLDGLEELVPSTDAGVDVDTSFKITVSVVVVEVVVFVAVSTVTVVISGVSVEFL